jgi:hypothetical protein
MSERLVITKKQNKNWYVTWQNAWSVMGYQSIPTFLYPSLFPYLFLPHHHLYAYHPIRHLPPYMLTYLPTSPHHHLYAYHPIRHLPPYMLTYLPTSPHIVLPTYISTTSVLFDELFFMWILHPYLKIWIQWVFYLSYFSYFYYPPIFFFTYLPKTYVTLMSTNENNANASITVNWLGLN